MALMNFAPATVVKLLTGVPLDSTYVNTRDFPTVAAQQAYFNSFILQTFEQFTYQREKSVIRVPIPYETAVKANYCMYQNSNFSSKWFYAFVTSVEYVNPEMTAVTIETDVVQTWMFDYVVHPTLIERETPASDPLYGNMLEEGLEFGPIKVEKVTSVDYTNAMGVLVAFFEKNADNPGMIKNGVFSGAQYRFFFTSQPGGLDLLEEFLKEMDTGGLADNIIGLVMIPGVFWNRVNPIVGSTNVTVTTGSIDGYTPRNKKVLGWPYHYIGINNNSGDENLLRLELFSSSGTLTFEDAGAANLTPQGMLYPLNYAGRAKNYDEGVVLSNFPQCSWNSNAYANWIARNKNSYSLSMVSAGIGVVGGIVGTIASAVTGNIGGALSGAQGVTSALQTFGQAADRSLYPAQIQGQVHADVLNSILGRIGYTVKEYCITAAYAKILDQFFDLYGYKTLRRGVPATKSRTRWNYVKTAGVSITGPIPTDHLKLLEQIYDRGTTFWHDNNVGDYTAANGFAA